jgi:hypothetical protein
VGAETGHERVVESHTRAEGSTVLTEGTRGKCFTIYRGVLSGHARQQREAGIVRRTRVDCVMQRRVNTGR